MRRSCSGIVVGAGIVVGIVVGVGTVAPGIEGRIVLTPVRINRADAVRSKLADLRITERDAADAVAWVRDGDNRAR